MPSFPPNCFFGGTIQISGRSGLGGILELGSPVGIGMLYGSVRQDKTHSLVDLASLYEFFMAGDMLHSLQVKHVNCSADCILSYVQVLSSQSGAAINASLAKDKVRTSIL